MSQHPHAKDEGMSAGNPAVAIVTGASSGIGFAVAEAFARRGSPVVLSARDETRLRAAAERLGAPERIAAVAGDIGDAATGRRLVAAAVERFGRVDVIVHSAGIFSSRPFTDYGEEDLDAMFRTNLRGVVTSTQAAVQQMRRQGGGGAVVIVSAAIALQPLTAAPASAPVAFKGGLNAFTRALALELAPERIRVNAVAPGIIRTPLLGLSDEQFDAMGGQQPIGRVGEVNGIAEAVLYLAHAPFTTGAVLPVNGGMASGR